VFGGFGTAVVATSVQRAWLMEAMPSGWLYAHFMRQDCGQLIFIGAGFDHPLVTRMMPPGQAKELAEELSRTAK